MSTERNYPEIGNVIYTKSYKAKSYRIKVDAKERVLVTVPSLGTIKQAEHFVLSKKDWIFNAKAALKEKRSKYSFGFIQYNNKVSLNIIAQTERKDIISTKLRNATEMTIAFPQEADINLPNSQENIQKCFDKLLLIVAKNYLPNLIAEVSVRVNLPYKSLKITSAKTRWGSCTHRNTINLSKYLVLLPEKLIEYIIIHELCHTVHKNHGADFHKLVDFHCGGKEKALAKELKGMRVI